MQPNFTRKNMGYVLRIPPLLFVLFCFFAGSLNAQTYVNGVLGTGATSKSGVAAPAGTQWHEMQNNTGNTTESNVSIAFDNTANAVAIVNSRTADDFVVPNGQTWNLSKMYFYGVVLPPAPLTSPITGIRIRIHNANPSGASTVLFGDLTTNRMSATSFSNIYAIANSQVPAPGTTPNQNFKVWTVEANVSVSLPPGTYWVEWQMVAAVRTFSLMSQPLNARTVPGYNAVSTFNGGAWAPVIDGGAPATAPDVAVDFAYKFDYTASCVNTTLADAPVVSPLPPSVCAGTSTTLSIIGGSLNAAQEWRWYQGSTAGPLVGTGPSITVSPAVTTTYVVRGEGGPCVTGPGPTTTRVLTVTNCTCVTPEAASICAGTIQKLQVTPTGVTQTTFNGAAITINAVGAATPYPSNVVVSGLPATGAGVQVANVKINGFTHTFPDDVDILLQSPTGQNVILMSDAGTGGGVTNVSFTLTDGAAGNIPGVIANAGTYKPTNNLGGLFGVEPDNWPAPGPGSVTQPTPTLSSFTGTNNPNGTWKLFVVDDFTGDFGAITSWSITFNIVPTAVWTSNIASPPNTMFTDVNGTTAYVAGTQTDVIYVNPSVTTIYTATITGGPCAGANNITVTVLPKPTIGVTPTSGCSPLTLTANGGSTYQWTPATGLNTTNGPTVIASPTATTVYTVTGYAANGCSNTATATVNAGPTASVIVAPPSSLTLLSEGFEGTVLPAGWNMQNLSTPIGTTPNWVFGSAVLAPAQNGTANSYALGNFNNVAGNNTISNWLITPPINAQNGDVLSFWTRTVAAPAFPDRLEVRLNPLGTTNVGSTNATVGDFTTLLLTVNSGLTTTGYPNGWTQFTVTLTGLSGPSRIGFRYFVTSGGPAGANSDNIGIDNVQVTRALGGICANNTTNISVNITGGVGPYTLVYSNGTTNTTFTGYTSGFPIQVSPAVTTTYTIVSVTGANGCPGVNNTGSATVVVVPPATFAAQPSNAVTCNGNNATFSVTMNPTVGNAFQWQVSTDNGATWSNVPNAAPYSGVSSNTLTITGATSAMNNYRYRVIVNGQCNTAPITSNSGTLSVNVTPTITTQPGNSTTCVGNTATFTVVNTGVGSTYQWQVSTDNGLTWSNVAGTGATLSVPNVTMAMLGYRYRVIVTNPTCATTVMSDGLATLTPSALPTVSISAPDLLLTPGQNTTITATPSPAGTYTYSWTLNGNAIAGTTNTLPVSVTGTGLGLFRARVTNALGCTNVSNELIIGGEASDRLWLFPNPSNGVFQVRLYYNGANIEKRTVSIFKDNGQLVATKEFVLDNLSGPYYQMNFSMPRLAAGTYVVMVDDKHSGLKTSGLLVVQREN